MSKNVQSDHVNQGWKLDGDEIVVVMCDMNAAPDSLPKIIRCNCKTGFSGKRFSGS